MATTAALELAGLLHLRELRERLFEALDVQTRVRLRAVSRQLREWAEESIVSLRWTSSPMGSGSWSDRVAGLLNAGGQPAHWSVCAAFEQAHGNSKEPSLNRSWMQNLRLLDLSLQNWRAAARGMSSHNVFELISEARRSLRVLRLDSADAILPLPSRRSLFSKGSAYHAKVTMLPQLRELCATDAYGLGDDEATALALGCPQLQRLCISHDSISPNGWYELLSALHRLDEIEIAFSSVNDDALTQPGSLLAPTPTCRCGAGGCRCQASRPLLRCFKATSCCGVTNATLRQLLDRLRPAVASREPTETTTGRLTMLPPPGWLAELRQDQGPTSSYLRRQASLTALNICSCGLTSGLELVAEAAEAGHLPALVELGLRDGQVRGTGTDDAAMTTRDQESWLQTVLSCCSRLKHIDVRGCVGGGGVLADNTELEKSLLSLRSCSAGFLLHVLVGADLRIPSGLVELRLGLGARVNDALLCAVAASGSAVSLQTVELAFGVFEDGGLVRN